MKATVAFTLVLAACSAGILAMYGRTTGIAAVLAITALELFIIGAHWKAYSRLCESRIEAAVSWALCAALVGLATLFYVLDWRAAGGVTIGVYACMLLVDAYVVAMRPDLVEKFIQEDRDGRRGPGHRDDGSV